MADISKTLEFKIITPAELAGAQQAADAIERVIGKKKALHQDYSQEQKDLDTINGSLNEYQKSTNTAGESVDILNTRGREMNRLIAEADRALPGAGELLRASFRPETLGIAAVVLLLQQVVSKI